MRRNQVEPKKPARDTSLEGFASTCSMLAIGLFALTLIFKNFVVAANDGSSSIYGTSIHAFIAAA